MAFGFFKKKEVEQIEYTDKNLYILSEIPKSGLVSHLEANGIHVKYVTTNIDQMILKQIRERDPIRLIVIDFGSGVWKTLEAINNIVGLVGQSVSEDGTKSATVFTRNGSIKKELKDKGIAADVREFKGVSDVVKALMEYPENYVTEGAKDFQGENSTDLSQYKYARIAGDIEEGSLMKFRNPMLWDITSLDVSTEGSESLAGFKCKF